MRAPWSAQVESAIYVGTLRHRRFEPVGHAFQYRLFMLYLDLEELPELLDAARWWSRSRPALGRFLRSDYLGDPAQPLAQSVSMTVEEATGRRPKGPIRVLTHLRYFGYCFNPVSFYYCFDSQGDLQTVVSEITNTPWGERHHYVVQQTEGRDPIKRGLRARFSKEFHVSPFFDLDQIYEWHLGIPGERLVVHMKNFEGERRVFDATLRMRRQDLTPQSLDRVLLRFPFMTLRVMATIHWQAVRLFCKRVPFYAHPTKRAVGAADR